MKASVEKIENNVADVAIEVDEASVSQAIEETYRKLGASVTVPGFRKGKAPRRVLERVLAKDRVYQQAQGVLFPRAYTEALKEIDVKPIGRPKVKVEEFEEGKPGRFRVEIPVKPEVALGDYSSIRIPRKPVDVTDEEINSQLEQLQEAHAKFEDADKDSIEQGDYVRADLEVYIEGKPAPHFSRKEAVIQIGVGLNPKEFEEGLLGMHPGEEKEIALAFPEDMRPSEYAGKPALYKVKVHKILRQGLPPLDDEFAKAVAKLETLEEVKARIREAIKTDKERAVDTEARNLLLREVLERANVEIPDSAVEDKAEDLLEELEAQLKVYRKASLDDYLKQSGTSEKDLRERYREEARRLLKEEFVFDAIAQAEGIEVTQEELDAALAGLTGNQGGSIEKTRRSLSESGGLDRLRDAIARNKAMDLLVKRCVINPEAEI